MTVKQRSARIIGRELNLRTGLRVHEQHIFDDAANILLRRALLGGQTRTETANLKTMAVQVQWMVIPALVDELQSIAPASDERCCSRLGIRMTVDGPRLHGPVAAEFRLQHERNDDRRLG